MLYICAYLRVSLLGCVCVSGPLRETTEQGHDLASTAGLSVCLVSVTIAMALCRQEVYIWDLKVVMSLPL